MGLLGLDSAPEADLLRHTEPADPRDAGPSNPRSTDVMRGVNMHWRIAAIVLITVAAVSSHTAPGSGDGAVESCTEASLDQFADGAWELRVDRAWPSSGGHRSFRLVEDDCQPVSDGATQPILVSDGGSQVIIGTAQESGPRLSIPLRARALRRPRRLHTTSTKARSRADGLTCGRTSRDPAGGIDDLWIGRPHRLQRAGSACQEILSGDAAGC